MGFSRMPSIFYVYVKYSMYRDKGPSRANGTTWFTWFIGTSGTYRRDRCSRPTRTHRSESNTRSSLTSMFYSSLSNGSPFGSGYHSGFSSNTIIFKYKICPIFTSVVININSICRYTIHKKKKHPRLRWKVCGSVRGGRPSILLDFNWENMYIRKAKGDWM